jgi:hypothetical protein
LVRRSQPVLASSNYLLRVFRSIVPRLPAIRTTI